MEVYRRVKLEVYDVCVACATDETLLWLSPLLNYDWSTGYVYFSLLAISNLGELSRS